MALANVTDIIRLVRNYPIETTLIGINRLAVEADNNDGRMIQETWPSQQGQYGKPLNIVVGSHQLAVLAKIALANHYPGYKKKPSRNDLVKGANWVGNLGTSFTEEASGTVGIPEMLFQMSCQQFPFQYRGEGEDLGRALTLFVDVPKAMQARGVKLPFDLEHEFRAFTGLTIEQFIWAGTMLFGASMDGPVQRAEITSDQQKIIDDNWRGLPESRPTNATIGTFLGHVSQTASEFKSQIGDLRRGNPLEVSTDFQPLLSRPVVRLKGNRLIVPVPKLLLDRITNGLFHDFSAHLDGTAKAAPFRQHFGDLFEEYVRQQLLLVFDESELTPETPYEISKGVTHSTPDWTVNAPDGALAIECRTSSFSLATRKSGKIEQIRSDIDKICTAEDGPLRHMPGNIADLVDGVAPIALVSHDPVRGVLCTWESLEPLSLFGQLIIDSLLNGGQGPLQPFHLLPLSYLDRLCATRDRSKFYEGLDELTVENGWRNYFGEQPSTRFDEVIGQGPWTNPITTTAYNNFLFAVPDLGSSDIS